MAQFHRQFVHFFPAWTEHMEWLLTGDCQSDANAYFNYTTDSKTANYNLLQCLLDGTPNYRTTEMSISAVILGMAPQLIQTLGPTTLQTSLLMLHRPTLAFLLSIGAPAVQPMRGDEYLRALHDATDTASAVFLPRWLSGRVGRVILSVVGHVLVLASAVNVAFLGLQLGFWSISIIGVGQVWLPLLWMYLTPVVHVVGMLALWACVRVSFGYVRTDGRAATVWQCMGRVVLQLVLQEPLKPQLQLRRPDALGWYYGCTWFLYIGTTLHVIYGGIAMASLLFISAVDSVAVVARLAGSTIVCRVVLMLELAMLQERGLSLGEAPARSAVRVQEVREVQEAAGSETAGSEAASQMEGQSKDIPVRLQGVVAL